MTIKYLVCNLAPRRWVAATPTGVNNFVAEILVVHITARENYQFRSRQRGTDDAGLQRTMDARVIKLATRSKRRTQRNASDFSNGHSLLSGSCL